MMSTEEGLSILRKMRDESSPIYVRFVEGDEDERFVSAVCEVTDESLILSRYEVGVFVLDLHGIEFIYSDPREAEQPEEAAQKFDSCLQLSWPNGSWCQLYTIRDGYKGTG